jgi:hypothetical protein
MSAYRLAVVLSGGSAALGLLRELLVFRRLGLGASNDELQFALSITYTIALLGDPLRLASLNMLSRRLSASSRLLLAGVVGLAVVATTAAYTTGGPNLPRSWIVVAAAAGAMNLRVSWTIPRRLRDGPFLLVHALTVLPNVVIVAGLLWPAPTDVAFAARVVFLFAVAPLVQLAGFLLLGRGSARAEAGLGAGAAEVSAAIGWHGVAAAGTMGTQFVIRAALTAYPGTLSAFTLMLRITETIRAVFVDSWVASRVQEWTRVGAAGAVAAAARLLSWRGAAVVTVLGLLLALAWPGADGTLLAPPAVVVAAGIYPVVVYRVGWQAVNTSTRPGSALPRVAAMEWGIAALGWLAAALAVQPVALLPWLAYVVRPVAGARIIAAASPEAA